MNCLRMKKGQLPKKCVSIAPAIWRHVAPSRGHCPHSFYLFLSLFLFCCFLLSESRDLRFDVEPSPVMNNGQGCLIEISKVPLCVFHAPARARSVRHASFYLFINSLFLLSCPSLQISFRRGLRRKIHSWECQELCNMTLEMLLEIFVKYDMCRGWCSWSLFTKYSYDQDSNGKWSQKQKSSTAI